MTASVSLEKITCTFASKSGEGSYTAVRDVDLAIADGEFVSVVGPTGCGKSTLLNVAAGLLRPSSGSVKIHGEPLAGINRRAGYMFQSEALLPWRSALGNVVTGLEFRGEDATAAREKGEAWLERVGLAERMNSLPHQLSGGEKQRVALCRALINQPQIVFADEPTGNLDSRNSQAILELLQTLQQEQRTTLVLATHSAAIARAADRCITLQDGRILATPDQGPADAQ